MSNFTSVFAKAHHLDTAPPWNFETVFRYRTVRKIALHDLFIQFKVNDLDFIFYFSLSLFLSHDDYAIFKQNVISFRALICQSLNFIILRGMTEFRNNRIIIKGEKEENVHQVKLSICPQDPLRCLCYKTNFLICHRERTMTLQPFVL